MEIRKSPAYFLPRIILIRIVTRAVNKTDSTDTSKKALSRYIVSVRKGPRA